MHNTAENEGHYLNASLFSFILLLSTLTECLLSPTMPLLHYLWHVFNYYFSASTSFTSLSMLNLEIKSELTNDLEMSE